MVGCSDWAGRGRIIGSSNRMLGRVNTAPGGRGRGNGMGIDERNITAGRGNSGSHGSRTSIDSGRSAVSLTRDWRGNSGLRLHLNADTQIVDDWGIAVSNQCEPILSTPNVNWGRRTGSSIEAKPRVRGRNGQAVKRERDAGRLGDGGLVTAQMFLMSGLRDVRACRTCCEQL